MAAILDPVALQIARRDRGLALNGRDNRAEGDIIAVLPDIVFTPAALIFERIGAFQWRQFLAPTHLRVLNERTPVKTD